MNIAACSCDLTYLENLRKNIALHFGYLIDNIDTFISGETFLQHINVSPISYDFFILDIVTKDKSGIDVANIIRHNKKYKNSIIFLISSYTEELQKIIDIRPYAYLNKRDSFQFFNKYFREALDACTSENTNIVIKSGKNYLQLNPNDIYYIETQNRIAHIHTTKGLIDFSVSVKDLVQTLGKYNTTLVRINNAAFINMIYLLDKTYSNVTLNDGRRTTLPLTRTYKDDFMMNFRKYMPLP